jgi:hypothetical protein
VVEEECLMTPDEMVTWMRQHGVVEASIEGMSLRLEPVSPPAP